MSIVSEVNRLKDAKTAIKTAIEGKGVTVPDATMLDGMAALIESIEAGGGGGIPVSQGTYTAVGNHAWISVEHGLGVIPTFAAIFTLYDSGPYGVVYLFHNEQVIHIRFASNIYKYEGSLLTEPGKTDANPYNVRAYGANESSISFGVNVSSYMAFRDGYSYQWIVGAIE